MNAGILSGLIDALAISGILCAWVCGLLVGDSIHRTSADLVGDAAALVLGLGALSALLTILFLWPKG